MFAHQSYAKTTRASSSLAVAENDELFNADSDAYSPRAGAMTLVVTSANQTAGSVTVSLQGSYDGTTWFNLDQGMSVTLSANGTGYIPFVGAIPAYVRAVSTPGIGYDGNLSHVLRSSGLLQ